MFECMYDILLVHVHTYVHECMCKHVQLPKRDFDRRKRFIFCTIYNVYSRWRPHELHIF